MNRAIAIGPWNPGARIFQTFEEFLAGMTEGSVFPRGDDAHAWCDRGQKFRFEEFLLP